VFRFGKAEATRKERLRMNAMKARHRAAEAAYKAQAAAGPTIEKAGSAIGPKVDAARTKVTEELVPRAGEIMSTAVERSRPVRTEAKARGVAVWHALRGEYSATEIARKSHKVRNTALAMGGLGAAAAAGYAATRRSRGPEWMHNGSEEPFATAAQPPTRAESDATSPQASTGSGTSSRRRASSASSASASTSGGTASGPGSSRPASDDKAGASPDEAIADNAETSFGTPRSS
jgi:hypothetical protein